jgi:hypothetical protein
MKKIEQKKDFIFLKKGELSEFLYKDLLGVGLGGEMTEREVAQLVRDGFNGHGL